MIATIPLLDVVLVAIALSALVCWIAILRPYYVIIGAIVVGAILVTVDQAQADTPIRVTVSATVDDPELNEPYVRQLIRDASDILAPTGVQLELVEYETNDPAPGVTNADKLLELTRLYRKRQIGNIYVLITRRAIMVGASRFVGYASMGPACTSGAIAAFNPLPQTIAHEVLHTLQIEHDPEIYGYLMSPAGMSVTPSEYTMRQLATYRATGTYDECGTHEGPSVSSAQAPMPAGGGGAMECWFLLILMLVIVIGSADQRRQIMKQRREIRRRGDIIDRLSVAITEGVKRDYEIRNTSRAESGGTRIEPDPRGTGGNAGE